MPPLSIGVVCVAQPEETTREGALGRKFAPDIPLHPHRYLGTYLYASCSLLNYHLPRGLGHRTRGVDMAAAQKYVLLNAVARGSSRRASSANCSNQHR